MKTEISYKALARGEADAKALADIQEYLASFGTPPSNLFGDLVALATCIENEIPVKSTDGEPRVPTLRQLNITFGFAGIEGYPFHAFCRRYARAKYTEWMESGSDSIKLDDEGFPVAKETTNA